MIEPSDEGTKRLAMELYLSIGPKEGLFVSSAEDIVLGCTPDGTFICPICRKRAHDSPGEIACAQAYLDRELDGGLLTVEERIEMHYAENPVEEECPDTSSESQQ